MTVHEYLVENPNKISYTVSIKSKRYLCRLDEADSIFGHLPLKRVSFMHGSENLVLLAIATK